MFKAGSRQSALEAHCSYTVRNVALGIGLVDHPWVGGIT